MIIWWLVFYFLVFERHVDLYSFIFLKDWDDRNRLWKRDANPVGLKTLHLALAAFDFNLEEESDRVKNCFVFYFKSVSSNCFLRQRYNTICLHKHLYCGYFSYQVEWFDDVSSIAIFHWFSLKTHYHIDRPLVVEDEILVRKLHWG